MTANNIAIVDFNQDEQLVRTTYDTGANVHTTWTNSKLQVSNADVTFANPVPTQEPDAAGSVPVTGVGSANRGATGNLFALDTTGYESISVHVRVSGNGATIEYKGSDDNTNWFQVLGYVEANVAGGATPVTRTSASTGGFVFPVAYRYFMANVSSYSGSVNVAASYALRKSPITLGTTWVNNSNSNPIPVLQVANTPINAVTVAANTTSQILIAPNTHRTGILIQNQGAGNVAIVPQGGSNTTAAFNTDGSMILLVDASLEFDKAIQDGFNCITDTGTSNVAVWEF